MALPTISKPGGSDFHARFFQLASVNILSNLMVPLAGLVDVAFLGHLEEIRHLAGVALANVLFNYIYWTFGFLRMGTTGTTAQAVGQSDEEAVLLTLLRNGVLALGIGLIILVLQHGKLSIAEVAGRVGFCDQSHFTRYFKRIVGVTPKQLLQG